MSGIASRTTDWWSVYSFVAPFLDAAGDYPMAGTISWRELPDDDPRKWAALLDGASHHILRVEHNQRALAEASEAVAASTDWGKVARELLQLDGFRRAHPWSRHRAVSND
ncbi:MAG: DUF2742 domain-containing protein [Mycolicibacter algericus]|uniref:DUF2742 domain-containing protein n=1 Tax=Mycolicibacter algericus TaxID=1288388 RepID=UPI003C725495